MYIQKAEITNIKSIEKFEIEFKNPAGWHVLIGDNGSGKTTIVRALALSMISESEEMGLRENWDDWIKYEPEDGRITLFTSEDREFDKPSSPFPLFHPLINRWIDNLVEANENKQILNFRNIRGRIQIIRSDFFFKDDKWESIDIDEMLLKISSEETKEIKEIFKTLPDDYFDKFTVGPFSSAFGPYRRFEGGSPEWDEVYNNPSLKRLAAHLSVFDESVALTEPIKWLKDLNYKTLEKNKESKHTLDNLKKLINSEDFLPHNSKLEKISSDGVFFKDGNGSTIAVNQMSDGYRSILSLTFELIRQLVRVYGSEKVFKNIENGEMFIDLPGVVLIDEIDAHLHPTWQTRIGQWFLKYFPQLQFIVTTHSPLVCRACEKGSIWRLAAPGSDEESGEVTGIDRDRLIYGNILDAYGTGVFGENTSISQDSNEMLNRLSELNVKSITGLITDEESNELQELKAKSPTDDTQKRTGDWLIEKFEKLEDYLKEKEINFTKSEEDSRNELQKSRAILAQEWKNLKDILGMSKTGLDKEKDGKSELKTTKTSTVKNKEK